jgi:glycosyltransferase involved in cell wall biosynthesis
VIGKIVRKTFTSSCKRVNSQKETNPDEAIKVICVVDYYLPGFKGGGPIRTIANMRALLAGRVDIAVFTRDQDLGSTKPYAEVQPDTWIEGDDGPIFYASPSMFGYAGLKQAISSSSFSFDLLYLNSYFGFRSSIQLYLWFQRAFASTPILLAPRGEFSSGALALKPLKKRIFIALSRSLNLYRNIIWHASTGAERDDILRQFHFAEGRIRIAEDPINVNIDFDVVASYHPSPRGSLRLAFISRISPMKNLDGLLQILTSAVCQVDLDIFGPIEDTTYWKKCKSLIAVLPSNVNVSYEGALHPEGVSKVFSGYDMFAFPSLGENFGHVIFEALRAGTPVLVSDQTPWKADTFGALTVVPITETVAWEANLQAVAERNENEKMDLRLAARAYAENFANSSENLVKNLSMFQSTVLMENFKKNGKKPRTSCD